MFDIGDKVKLIHGNNVLGINESYGVIAKIEINTTHNEYKVIWSSSPGDYLWLSESYLEINFELVEHNNKTMFKIGDKVKILHKSTGSLMNEEDWPDRIGYIKDIAGNGSGSDAYNCIILRNENNDNGGMFFAPQDLELINKNKNMNTLTSTIKRLFNKKKQLQYKAGFIDNCGVMTPLGKEEFDAILQDAHEDEFTAAAVERIKEEKEDK